MRRLNREDERRGGGGIRSYPFIRDSAGQPLAILFKIVDNELQGGRLWRAVFYCEEREMAPLDAKSHLMRSCIDGLKAFLLKLVGNFFVLGNTCTITQFKHF